MKNLNQPIKYVPSLVEDVTFREQIHSLQKAYINFQGPDLVVSVSNVFSVFL